MKMLLTLPPMPRPESRQRDPLRETAWADTLPLLFRSEGFAEDLGGTAADAAAAAATGATSLARVGALVRAVMLGSTVPPRHADRAAPAHGPIRRP